MIKVKEATSALADVFVTIFWAWFWGWFLVGGWWIFTATMGYLSLPDPSTLPEAAGMLNKIKNFGESTLTVSKNFVLTLKYLVHGFLGLCYMLIGLAPILAKMALPWPRWIVRSQRRD